MWHRVIGIIGFAESFQQKKWIWKGSNYHESPNTSFGKCRTSIVTGTKGNTSKNVDQQNKMKKQRPGQFENHY